jgi:signal transduction histidine kinase
VTWTVTPRTVTLIWTDNGEGLPPEVADRLFDPYFSTKSKGTGLGLAICRNLADRMGGTISLGNRNPDGGGQGDQGHGDKGHGDGDPGRGARAALTLPRA